VSQTIKKYLPLFGIAAVIIVLDQVSKSYIRTHLALGEMWSPWEWLTPYARIVHWYNTGVAFGMFQGLGNIFKYLALLVAAVIIFYYPRVSDEDWSLRLAMSLQLGGALGNLIDRIFNNGMVTDFISVGNFPVFNIADSSITVGVGVLLLGMWLQERKSSHPDDAVIPASSDLTVNEK